MARPKSLKKKPPRQETKGLPADMSDPVDKFHATKDKLMLNPSDDDRDSDSLDDGPVYDLQDVQDESDDDFSEDAEDEQEGQDQGLLGKCALLTCPLQSPPPPPPLSMHVAMVPII